MEQNTFSLTSVELAHFCAKTASDKLASDILILDLKSIETSPCDFFVICDCSSDVQVKAIVDEIEKRVRFAEISKPKIEGLDHRDWVILDFFDVVVHIMLKETREYYRLEKLWGDADFFGLDSDDSMIKVGYEEIKVNF